MSEQTVGYIVLVGKSAWGWEEHRKVFPEQRGVLFLGKTATVFPTRAAAARAIKRSNAYADARGYGDWERDYRIVRLTSRGLHAARAFGEHREASE